MEPYLTDSITFPSGNTVTIKSSVKSAIVSECFSLVMYTFGIHIRSTISFWHTTSDESIGAKWLNASRTSLHRNCNSMRTLKSFLSVIKIRKTNSQVFFVCYHLVRILHVFGFIRIYYFLV